MVSKSRNIIQQRLKFLIHSKKRLKNNYLAEWKNRSNQKRKFHRIYFKNVKINRMTYLHFFKLKKRKYSYYWRSF